MFVETQRKKAVTFLVAWFLVFLVRDIDCEVPILNIHSVFLLSPSFHYGVKKLILIATF